FEIALVPPGRYRVAVTDDRQPKPGEGLLVEVRAGARSRRSRSRAARRSAARYLARVKLGAYEVGGTIGQGGAGTVLRARDPAGRDVAIKVLRERRPEILSR